MIFQALGQYYERKKAELPPDGFQTIEIPFVIVLDRQGGFVQLDDTRENKRGRTYTVPRAETRSGTMAWNKPNLLWDHYGFVLGAPKDDTDKDRETAAKQHGMFVQRTAAVAAKLPPDHPVQAVNAFLQMGDFAAVFAASAWPSCLKIKGANLSFRLFDASYLVGEDPALSLFVAGESIDEETGEISAAEESICLVTGNRDNITRLHPQVGGIGEKPVPIAAINNGVSPAFSSFGKSQGFNFPVGQQAAFAYTTGLRHLLRKDSAQKFRLGDTVFSFWAEKPTGEPFESNFLSFLNPPADNPDQGTLAVASLLQSVRNGTPFTSDDQQRFYILGLAPNSARVAVRVWQIQTIAELGEVFYRHFSALEISRHPNESPTLPLYRLLSSTALLGKMDNVAPNLGADVMRAILSGQPYPETLMHGALRRIRAEQQVTYPRAALLKAYLIRNLQDKEISVALNRDNNDPGYRLGRLFAALERIQERAQGGSLNATIRDRYYGSFSSTPVTALPLLMKLKNHHLAKLPNRGEAVNLEKLLAEILDGLNDVPSRLNLAEQARFAVGYYHQRQDFFSKANVSATEQSVNDKE